MKIKVDMELCQNHGQCIIAAPKVFQFDGNQKLIWIEQPDQSQRQAVEDAADVCPVQAITIED